MSEQYTPDTRRVRGFYKHATGWSFDHDPQPHIAAMMEKQAVEFDAWLAETVRAAKAEAWDEGNDAGEICAMDAESPDHVCQRNPYRQEGQ